ncbi:MAG: hypothetical protein RI907_3733 [Pseudomonadota bacterium]|jgi:hypothetical protein
MRTFPTRSSARCWTWVALWLFCLSTLMPGLSAWAAAARAGQGTAWMEVCSSQGTRWVRSAPAADDGAPQGAAHVGHCAFCVLQDHVPLVPVAEPEVDVVALPPEGFVPTLFLRSPRTLHAWSPAAARAPPASV